jgi:hypothetical protein
MGLRPVRLVSRYGFETGIACFAGPPAGEYGAEMSDGPMQRAHEPGMPGEIIADSQFLAERQRRGELVSTRAFTTNTLGFDHNVPHPHDEQHPRWARR